MELTALSSALGTQQMMGNFITDIMAQATQAAVAQAAEIAQVNLAANIQAQEATIAGLGEMLDVYA
ncbi:MAG: hypothetical protein ACOX5R_22080 [bacterium]|jgi:hypothetical protein